MVKISGDGSGLRKELNKIPSSAQAAFSANPVNEFTNALSGATNGINGIVSKISGLAAITAGGFGLGAVVQGAVDAGESVYQLSTKLGISASEGVELARILKLTNGEAQTFSTAMMRLDKNFTASGETGDKTRAVLEAFGVSLSDGNGKLLPLNQQLEQMSKGYELSAKNGLQEEFIMNTLGVRGMALVNTLKDYSEAKEAAARVQGVGLDPAQMHELGIEMKTLSIEASQVGLAFTSALAPVAQEIFPPLMSGLKSTAAFLAENKTGVIELTKDALELAVTYKSIQLLSAAGSSIGTFWQNAATQAEASMAATGTVTATLTANQEKAISRTVAISNKAYAKMEADAIKAAQSMGLSMEEYAAVVSEKSVQISNAAATAAESIRTNMTAAYLSSSVVATESAVTQITSIESIGIAAAEMNAAKTASTAESTAACTALVAESSLTQTESIALVGEASTVAGAKSVAAGELMRGAAINAATAQKELAAATALQGNAAVMAGEKTVGAMATAGVATRGLLTNVWALVGGWYGVAAAIGYAVYKLYEYNDSRNRIKGYGGGAEVKKLVSDDGSLVQYQKKAQINTFFGIPVYDWVNVSDAEREGLENAEKEPETPEQPDTTSPPVNMPDLSQFGNHKSGKSEAEKEFEKLQKKADEVNKEIDSAYQELVDNKIQRVDDWYVKEKEKLDASKDANKRYEDEVGELATVYAEKRRKAYAEMLSNSTSIWVEAARSQRELQNNLSIAGLEGPTKDLLEMQNKYNDSLTETEEKYKKLSVQFMSWDTETQTQYLLANPGVKKNDDGSLDFTKFITAERLAIWKNYELTLKNYHEDEKRYEFALTKAYNDRSISELRELLNKQSSIQAQYRAGQTAAMKEYYDLWSKTHRSKLEEMANMAQSFQQGLEEAFSGIGDNINSVREFFGSIATSTGKSLLKNSYEKMSAQITTNLFGDALTFDENTNNGMNTAGATLTTAGATLNTAAAALLQAATGLNVASGTSVTSSGGLVSGLLGGISWGSSSSVSSSGTASIADSGINYIPETIQLAEGGIATGPTLATIGEGRYKEAVIPLSKSNLEKLGGGRNGNNGSQIIFNVTSNDTQGFKKSQSQIMAEALNAAGRGRRNL